MKIKTPSTFYMKTYVLYLYYHMYRNDTLYFYNNIYYFYYKINSTQNYM